MAVVTCPRCGSQLELADQYLGREVRCGGCEGTFVANPDRPPDAPAPPAFAPASVSPQTERSDWRPPSERFRRRDDDDDRPRRRGRGYARDQLETPATGLQVVAWFGFFGVVVNLIIGAVSLVQAAGPQGGGAGAGGFGGGPGGAGGPGGDEHTINAVIHFVSAVITFGISWVILTGASKMKRLEGYTYAMAAAILAMIPCFSPCCFIGLPFGIIALIALNDPDVRDAFDDRAAYPD